MLIRSNATGGGRNDRRRPIYLAAVTALLCLCLLCACTQDGSGPDMPPATTSPGATIATATAGGAVATATATAGAGTAIEAPTTRAGATTVADISDIIQTTEATVTSDVVTTTEAVTTTAPTAPVTARPTATIATARPSADDTSATIATATATVNDGGRAEIATGGAGQPTTTAPAETSTATSANASSADGGTASVSASDVYAAMSAAAAMPEMFAVPEDIVADYYGVSAADYDDAVFMMCADSLKADEFAIAHAVDEAAVNRLVAMFELRRASKANEARDYSPEQFAIIDKCSVSWDGLWVAMIVSPDAAAFVSAYREAIG